MTHKANGRVETLRINHIVCVTLAEPCCSAFFMLTPKNRSNQKGGLGHSHT